MQSPNQAGRHVHQRSQGSKEKDGLGKWEPSTPELRRLEADRKLSEAFRDGVRAEVEAVVNAALEGLPGKPEDEWFIRGNDELVKRQRRAMETVAEALEGYRARLMNASHRIQLDHDRRKRGMP